jgi:hypothetical protein
LKKPFEFTDPRQRAVYDKLGKYISVGIAAFYRDACFILVNSADYLSTTLLVSHLYREIESALRAIGLTEDEKINVPQKSPTSGTIAAGKDGYDPKSKRAKSESTHIQQIEILANKFALTEEDRSFWVVLTAIPSPILIDVNARGFAQPKAQ